jgi:hypothetical protein
MKILHCVQQGKTPKTCHRNINTHQAKEREKEKRKTDAPTHLPSTVALRESTWCETTPSQETLNHKNVMKDGLHVVGSHTKCHKRDVKRRQHEGTK